MVEQKFKIGDVVYLCPKFYKKEKNPQLSIFVGEELTVLGSEEMFLGGDFIVFLRWKDEQTSMSQDSLVREKPSLDDYGIKKEVKKCFTCGASEHCLNKFSLHFNTCNECYRNLCSHRLFFEKRMAIPKLPKKDSVLESPRLFGVEMEVVAKDGSRVSGLYGQKERDIAIASYLVKDFNVHVERDGSLPSGISAEIVTHPMTGETGYEELKKIERVLERTKIGTDSSCGLHIHLSAKDYANRILNVKKLLLFYWLYEEFFASLVPNKRRDFRYSSSLRKYTTLEEIRSIKNFSHFDRIMYKAVNDEYIERAKRDKRGGGQGLGRYVYINLHSLQFRGTIEIRSHEGTIRANEIIRWVKLHAQVLDLVKELTINDIEKLWTVPATSYKKNLKGMTDAIFSKLNLTQEETDYFKKRQKKFGYCQKLPSKVDSLRSLEGMFLPPQSTWSILSDESDLF